MTDHGTDQARGHSIYPPTPRSEDLARPIETGMVAAQPRVSGTPKSVVKSPGAALVRVAKRLGVSTEQLVGSIPDDTLRRTRYPVREIPLPDGSVQYEHDLGIVEGRNASIRP